MSRALTLLELADQVGLPGNGVARRHLVAIERELRDAQPAHVVVLCDRFPVLTGRVFHRRWPDARVHVLSFGPPPPQRPSEFQVIDTTTSDVLSELVRFPAADVLLDLRKEEEVRKAATLRQAYLSLSEGGHYIVCGMRPDRSAFAGNVAQDVLDLVSTRMETRDNRRDNRWKDSSPLDRGIGKALSRVVVEDGFLAATKAGAHVLKLDAAAVREAIDVRGGSQAILFAVPPTTVESASTIWSNDAALEAERLPAASDVDELLCTVYSDAWCAPRQVAAVEGLLLPASYFLPWNRRHRTFGIHDYGTAYSQVPAFDEEELRYLRGTYFHLDNQMPGHYGHVITHDLSKLWAWDAALDEFPDLRVLLSPNPTTGEVPPHTWQLLEAFGIPRDRVTVFTDGVRVERLVTATQAFQQPPFLSPVVRSVWRRVADALLTQAGTDPLPDRIFVSRRGAMRRRCLNGPELESRFEAAGFTVVYPEDLPLPEQVRLFSSASVVAGYGGSGMINMVYSSGPATRIVVAARSYWPTNEYHLAAMFGGDLRYFWCDPVADGPQDGMHADFTFDFDRDGPALDALLQQLS